MNEDRYHRQRMVPQLGDAGQQRLADSSVAVIGCGALGTVAADLLARAAMRLRQARAQQYVVVW